MKVRAKLQCISKWTSVGGDTHLRLEAMYNDKDGTRAQENMAFSEATPAASFSMTVSKGKPAADAFVSGEAYYLDFTPANTAVSCRPLDATEATVESEIVAKGLTAPRVTPERIDEVLLSTEFYVFPGTTVTVCCLTLKNGAKVLGHNYGAIDAARQDWAVGRFEARAMAIEKVWELEGYALRERLVVPLETD